MPGSNGTGPGLLPDSGGGVGQQHSQQGAGTSTSSSSNPTSPSHGANAIGRVHRRILGQSVAAICQSSGFDSVQASSLEALTSFGHKYLDELCRSSRLHCEHTGRSLVTPGDVFVALVSSGLSLKDLPAFLHSLLGHSPRPASLPIKCQSPVKTPPVLRIAEARPHPSHFPNFLPPFPDSHTYIRTEVKDDLDNNYEKVRRLNAQNRRDIEKSLVGYALSIYPSVCLFQELAKRLQLEAKDALEKKQGEEEQHELLSEGDRNGQLEEENGNAGEEEGEGRGKAGSMKRLNGGDGPARKSATAVATSSSAANANGPSTIQELLLSEAQLQLRQTERSFVLRRIPASCHILLPFEESRPYLSALVTEDVELEEEHNYFAQILSKEMEEEDMADNNEEQDQEEQPMEVGTAAGE